VQRWILHADLDAFYAAVEQLDNPELRGKPVIVGGPPEARAVVTTASYEARPYGVRSAMPMGRALRLCPHAVRVSPRFDRYAEVSRAVMGIFRSVTDLVEPLSLDEAFLDISEAAAGPGGAEGVARAIKQRVRDETGLTVSIGLAANKSAAKVASDMRKPDGLVAVPPGGEAEFLAPLPMRVLWGVGPKAGQALLDAGFRTVGDIAAAAPGRIESLLGSRGAMLQAMARGIDERPVEASQERKSVGAENTFPHDLPDGPELREELRRVALGAAVRLQEKRLRCRTVVLKLRYAGFKTITRRASRPYPIDDPAEILQQAESLLRAVLKEEDRFRLIGVQCTNLVGGQLGQLSLFSAAR
jgi:DNA polymerase-4